MHKKANIEDFKNKLKELSLEELNTKLTIFRNIYSAECKKDSPNFNTLSYWQKYREAINDEIFKRKED